MQCETSGYKHCMCCITVITALLAKRRMEVCHIRGHVLQSGMNEFEAKLAAVYQKLPACLVHRLKQTAVLWKLFVQDRAWELQTKIITACGGKTIVGACSFVFFFPPSSFFFIFFCGAVRMCNHN